MRRKTLLLAIALILLTTTALGVGVYVFVSGQKSEEVGQVPDSINNNNPPDQVDGKCAQITYRNSILPKLSFEYNNCIFELTEQVTPSFSYEDLNNYKLDLTVKANQTAFSIVVEPILIFGMHSGCVEAEVTQISERMYFIESQEIPNQYLADLDHTSGPEICIGAKNLISTESILDSEKVIRELELKNYPKTIPYVISIQIANISPSDRMLFEEVIKTFEY